MAALSRQAAFSAPRASGRGALEFFTMDSCPYAQRVWITLEELGAPYEKTVVNVRERPEWYLELSPKGKVPCVRDSDGTVVYESGIVCEYLSERESGRLMPRGAAARARLRLWNDHLDSALAPAQFTFLMSREEEKEAEAREALEKALQYYEDNLVAPYLMGDDFSLADIHALPFFERLVVSLRHFKGFEIDAAKYPRLVRWMETAMAQPSFLATKRDEEDLKAIYERFLSADYKFGGLNKN